MKCVILIIASRQFEWYQYYINILRQYMNSHPNFKSYFIFGNPTNEKLDNFIDIKGDEITVDVPEKEKPGILIKTLEALKLINNTHEYDFIIRSNLSTFMHLEKCNDFLSNLSVDKLLGGSMYHFQMSNGRLGYVAGINILMSKQTVQDVINFDNFDFNQNDDVELFHSASTINKAKLIHFPLYCYENIKYGQVTHSFMQNKINKFNSMKQYYIRIKNPEISIEHNDRVHIDPLIHMSLYEEYYGQKINNPHYNIVKFYSHITGAPEYLETFVLKRPGPNIEMINGKPTGVKSEFRKDIHIVNESQYNVVDEKFLQAIQIFNMKSLVELVNNNITDKNTLHSYLKTYEELFQQHRFSAKNILEIGVQRGGGMQLYYNYFPNAKIHGVDVVKLITYNTERIQFYHTEAYSQQTIEQFDCKFDIIIDDGSHTKEHMIFVIQHYLNLLTENGLLIIEDVQSMDWVKELVDAFPEQYNSKVQVIDLRKNKNRYDDILIVLQK